MGPLQEALQLQGQGVISLVGAGGKTSLLYGLARELAAKGDPVLTTTTTRIYPPAASQSPRLLLADTAARILAQATVLLRENPHLTAAAGIGAGDGKLVGFPPELIDTLAGSGLFRWIIVEADGAAGRPLKAPADHEPVIPASSRWVVALLGLSALGEPLTERWVHRPERLAALTGLPAGSAITAAAVARLLADPRGSLKGAPPESRRLIFLNQADTPVAQRAAEAIAGLLRREPSPGGERLIVGRLQPAAAVIACHDLTAP